MNSALGENAVELIDSFLTPEEKAESDRRVAAIEAGIEARREKEISRHEKTFV